MEKAHTYQLSFNLERPNTYKENKSPWQLAQEKRPDITKEALSLPPVDLDALLHKKLDNLTTGGYYVSSSPFRARLMNEIAAPAFNCRAG